MDIITLYPSAYFVKLREVASRVVSRCVKITSSFFVFFYIYMLVSHISGWFSWLLVGFYVFFVFFPW